MTWKSLLCIFAVGCRDGWEGGHPYKVMGPLPGRVGSLVFARKAWKHIKKLVTITPLVAVDFSVHHVLFWGYRIWHLSYAGPRPMGTSRCFSPHRLTPTQIRAGIRAEAGSARRCPG